MLTIILVRPEKAINLGMIARAVKNFGILDLVLIDPKVKVNDRDALKFAKHAGDVLKRAKVRTLRALKHYDYVIATTSQLGSDHNILRTPLTPEQLFSKKELHVKSKIALLIGPEGEGLRNEEIEAADFTITIPTSKVYPTMNIANAVSVLCYEYSKQINSSKVAGHIVPVGKTELTQIQKQFSFILKNLEFSTPEKRTHQKQLWKKVISRAFLSKREAFGVLGFLKKLQKKL